MSAALRHLAVIMDGNRRWAKERGLPSLQGHLAGYERLKEAGDWCLVRGIEILTVFAFSTENWQRTQEEVGYLMNLFETALTKDLEDFKRKNVRIRVLGRRDGLPVSLQRAIEKAEWETVDNKASTFCLCLNYGGRAEIVDACKAMVKAGTPIDQITEAEIAAHLYWPNMPEPDLIIRSSGEERLSGFLTWEGVYSELYWMQKHWPDFDEVELDRAIETYNERQRRYGK